MSRKSIRFEVLATVVADMKRTFVTKDVSEDERMRKAHPGLLSNRQYHGFVGGALSDNRRALAIDEIRKATSRGSRWERRGAVNHQAPVSADIRLPTTKSDESNPLQIGPQHKGDKPFAARMRLHQSWYRSKILKLNCGTGPTITAKNRLGNMLTREDGAAGRNFLTPEIIQVARERAAMGGGAVESYRLFHNMLSSQPMCFNLFGPLVKDYRLARCLLAQILTDEIAEVTAVALEWAPEPAEQYLGDRTAFDAFVEYKTTDGRLCALGVETKLTEPFSQKEYDGDRYRRWMRIQGAPWRPEAELQVHAIYHNQLWRDHLLAVALRYHPRSEYAKVQLMVIHHPADPESSRAIRGYRQLLRDGDDTVLDVTLDVLVAKWTSAMGASPHSEWLREFGVRYLDFDRSANVT